MYIIYLYTYIYIYVYIICFMDSKLLRHYDRRGLSRGLDDADSGFHPRGFGFRVLWGLGFMGLKDPKP